MRTLAVMALTVGFFAGADVSAVPDKPPKKGTAAGHKGGLQGTWVVVALEVNGQNLGAAMKDFKLIISADKTVSKKGDQIHEQSTYKVDTTKKPHQIDITPVQGPNKGKKHRCIFLREGNTLKIGIIGEGGKRPRGFNAKDEPGLIVLVLKRENP
jgi:uncharacterized protein (TIGR03067 family)